MSALNLSTLSSSSWAKPSTTGQPPGSPSTLGPALVRRPCRTLRALKPLSQSSASICERLALLAGGAERERAGRRDLRVDDELLVDDAQVVAVLLAELVHRVADLLAVRARVVVRLDDRDLRVGRAVERIAVDRHRVGLRAIGLGARRALRLCTGSTAAAATDLGAQRVELLVELVDLVARGSSVSAWHAASEQYSERQDIGFHGSTPSTFWQLTVSGLE